jgi:hypothetical protein
MNKTQIIEAYARIRAIDQTIPDDVLDFMKDAALEKLQRMEDHSERATTYGKQLFWKSKKKGL